MVSCTASDIGERLRHAREKKQLSASKVDAGAGVLRGTCAAIERGTRPNPGIKTLKKIAIFLGVSTDWLAESGEVQA